MFERNPDKSIDVTADGAVALVDDFATAGEQEEISTPPMSDKRGYGNLSGSIGDTSCNIPHKGRLIVIEGLDGSGKETQAGLLRASLIECGTDLRSVSFPRYGSASSALVRMYLGGRFGSNPDDVNAYAASAFYAVDRYASYKEDWGAFYEAGGAVLADRWTTSNAVHQCSKLPREEWDAYLDWLYGFEYGLLGVPEPDLVVYLDMDSEAGARLVEERCEREGVAKDIHEADAAYLARCREAAAFCAERGGWARVECAPGRKLRTIEDVHQEVLGLVEALLEDEGRGSR